jgi:hypothetical protein
MQKQTLAEERYPCIIKDLRQNFGVGPEDQSEDGIIALTPKEMIFKRYLTWHGIIGYDFMIKSALEEIYGVEFKE